MEVQNKLSAWLCNFEVMRLIEESKKKQKTGGRKLESSQNATVLYEINQYLEQLNYKKQSQKKIEKLMEELLKFPIQLTKLEKLMICNAPPETILQMRLLVKESEKLSDEQICQWLKKIKNILK